MAIVTKTNHPKSSKIWALVAPGDFIDGYQIKSDLPPKQAAEIAFKMPIWATTLLLLRNAIVKPFGLKTEIEDETSDTIFPTTFESEDEILLGTDDKHLNFRISVLQQDGRIHMATWVHRNNWFGRLYLMIVMPFHILIVRNCMTRVARTRIASEIG